MRVQGAVVDEDGGYWKPLVAADWAGQTKPQQCFCRWMFLGHVVDRTQKTLASSSAESELYTCLRHVQCSGALTAVAACVGNSDPATSVGQFY